MQACLHDYQQCMPTNMSLCLKAFIQSCQDAVHANVSTNMRKFLPTWVHAYQDSYMPTLRNRKRTCLHACQHASIASRMRTYVLACLRSYQHAYMPTKFVNDYQIVYISNSMCKCHQHISISTYLAGYVHAYMPTSSVHHYQNVYMPTTFVHTIQHGHMTSSMRKRQSA